MRFWDASALVPLVIEERASPHCRRLFRSDPDQVVWVLTSTEVLSALYRRLNEQVLADDDVRRAEKSIAKLAVRWEEVDAVLPVRDQAERLLRVHRLRAADALQLAAALVACDRNPRRRGFVTLDDGLGEAAEKEGFELIQPGA